MIEDFSDKGCPIDHDTDETCRIEYALWSMPFDLVQGNPSCTSFQETRSEVGCSLDGVLPAKA